VFGSCPTRFHLFDSVIYVRFVPVVLVVYLFVDVPRCCSLPFTLFVRLVPLFTPLPRYVRFVCYSRSRSVVLLFAFVLRCSRPFRGLDGRWRLVGYLFVRFRSLLVATFAFYVTLDSGYVPRCCSFRSCLVRCSFVPLIRCLVYVVWILCTFRLVGLPFGSSFSWFTFIRFTGLLDVFVGLRYVVFVPLHVCGLFGYGSSAFGLHVCYVRSVVGPCGYGYVYGLRSRCWTLRLPLLTRGLLRFSRVCCGYATFGSGSFTLHGWFRLVCCYHGSVGLPFGSRLVAVWFTRCVSVTGLRFVRWVRVYWFRLFLRLLLRCFVGYVPFVVCGFWFFGYPRCVCSLLRCYVVDWNYVRCVWIRSRLVTFLIFVGFISSLPTLPC